VTNTPPPPAQELEPTPKPGLWARYLLLPLWLRILIPVLLVLLLTLIGVLAWSAFDDNEDEAAIEAVLEDLAEEAQTTPTTTIVEATTTTVEATTTTEEATTTTEEASTTTEATTTVPPTTAAPTTPPTTAAPTTPPTTQATTTTEPATTTTEEATTTTEEATTTTEEATTTTEEATTTTEPPAPPPSIPVIPVPPGAVYASATQFAQTWNQNTAGTSVPQISSSDVTQVADGPEADTVIVPLSDSVGLLGVIRNNDQSLAQVVLVSVPGDNDVAANRLYQSAFDVLVRTLTPSLDEAGIAQLAGQLGLSNSQPPFPAGTSATATVDAQRYTAGFRADLQASFISVVAAPAG